MQLDRHNIFPFLELSSYTYEQAQQHALLVDQHLGFQCERIEKQIQQVASPAAYQNWSHLSSQSFQTPYLEIRSILEILKPSAGKLIIDLGCAYGRMGLVLQSHFKEVRFTGFELEEKRVEEAQRIYLQEKVSNFIQVLQADLQSPSFKMPEADIYFIFDYGTQEAVQQTLLQLQELARTKKIQVVARGRLVRFLIMTLHPWLCQVEDPLHFSHFSIFNS